MSAIRNKFTLKPSALSQHTANFNKMLEQAPTPKLDTIELIKPVESINTESSSNQENKNDADSKKEFVFGEKLTDRVINADKVEEKTTDETEQVQQKAASSNAQLRSEKELTYDSNENDFYTLLKLNCKLFVLESNKVNWAERGYGIFKLIDTPDSSNCKLMMWTDKCFRLILNSKLFEKMQIDRANKKSIRFNAYDNGTIRIFLIKTSNPNDCDELYDLMTMRLNEFNSKLNKSQSNKSLDSSLNNQVLLSSECDLIDEKNENKLSKIQLYESNGTSQILLDLFDPDQENKVLISTYLKLIKILNSCDDKLELEINDDESSSSSSSPEAKYRVVVKDKTFVDEFLNLYKKETKLFRHDEDSSDSFSENQTEEENTQTSYTESGRDDDTGELKRKRYQDDDDDVDEETNTSTKKLEVECASNKRNVDEISSQEADTSKKTKVENK